MKYLQSISAIVMLLLIINPDISGQADAVRLDTVSILKDKRTRPIYKFNDSGILELQYSFSDPKYQSSGMGLGNAGNGFLTILTGINFATSKDLTYKIDGSIKCKDILPEWKINLFCEGHFEKNRERVKNDDGSWSVVSETVGSLYWDRDARGIILENKDTIGSFLIIMNPWTHPSLKPWSVSISSEPEPQIKTASNNKWYKKYISVADISYGIIGILRTHEFAIISNGTSRKNWFYTDKILSSIFYPDMDDTMISNKDRVQPYLLINKEIPQSERGDYFRLAMLSRLLSQTLDPNQ